MKWIKGRANDSGYQKLLLFQSTWLRCDCYILKYPKGSFLDWHSDPVASGDHWRFNWTFRKAKKGGKCQTIYPVTWHNKHAYLFRPDINLHRVTMIEEGTRYVFSFGWVRSTRP